VATDNVQFKKTQGGKSPQESGKPQVKIWQISIAVVILVGYFVWLAMRFFGPAPETKDKWTDDAAAIIAKVSPMAGPTGDISKIPEPDRTKFLASFKGAPVDPSLTLQRYWQKHH
jgi:hypothetical protein